MQDAQLEYRKTQLEKMRQRLELLSPYSLDFDEVNFALSNSEKIYRNRELVKLLG